MFALDVQEWKNQLLTEHARTGNGRNKLRLYKLYKEEYKEESYLRIPISRGHRSAFAKLRCGVAPLRVETGRYENIPFKDRLCFNCLDTVEDEIHVLLECPLYCDIRANIFGIYKQPTFKGIQSRLCLHISWSNAFLSETTYA